MSDAAQNSRSLFGAAARWLSAAALALTSVASAAADSGAAHGHRPGHRPGHRDGVMVLVATPGDASAVEAEGHGLSAFGPGGRADLLTGLAGGDAIAEDAPRRVVSMNLCTDQLALLLAAEGQVISVSRWAAQPAASNMVGKAEGIAVNSAGAEEIYLQEPDLVLAGAFTNRTGVAMLRMLGVVVEVFPAARRIEEIPEQLERMGRLLGREAAADVLIARFRAGLARIEAVHPPSAERPLAAYHYPNNYTSGDGTLAADLLDRAGFANAAGVLGLSGARRLALETLVMARPFVVRTWPISGTRRGRSFEGATHPALKRVVDAAGGAVLAERWQVCATPFVLQAVAALAERRPR